MLEITGLTKRFGKVTAVDDVDLTIEPGSFVGVLGRSGSGKSTLMRLINRLAEPDSGCIRWKGEEVTSFTPARLRAWRAGCGMIFQQHNLIPRLDVLTNVLIGRLARRPAWRGTLGLWSSTDRAEALATLDRFGLADYAGRRADTLSGGQQQRVAIARAIFQKTCIILADEPTASLDPRSAHMVMEALTGLHQNDGVTIICNIHSIELAETYCQQFIGMSSGRVTARGRAEELNPRNLEELYGDSRSGVEVERVIP